MKLIAWIFMKSGGHNTHFGEVRIRLETDTPMNDTHVFEPGWVRAPWLDAPHPIFVPYFATCDGSFLTCAVCRRSPSN